MSSVPSLQRRALMLQDRGWRAAWQALPEPLRLALGRSGLEAPDVWIHILDGIKDDDDQELELLGFVEDLIHPLKVEEDCIELLCNLYQAAGGPAAAFSRRVAGRDSGDVCLEHDLGQKRGAAEAERKDLAKLATASLAHLPAEWKAKRYRRSMATDTVNERGDEEEQARKRWVREVIGILQEADTPYARSLGLTSSTAVRERCCRNLRAPTLAKRVRDWRPLRRFLETTEGVVWPENEAQLLAYIAVREGEKAAKSAFTDVGTALGFFEQAAEIPEAQRLGSSPAVANAIKAAEREASRRPRPRGARPEQAPAMLVVILATLENVVVDVQEVPFARFFAWTRLVRHWTSLRCDDTAGIRPSGFREMARGLAGKLERTKTSGPGKTVQVLPFFLSYGCWIERKEWIRTGYALLTEVFGGERDYLVPLPSADFAGALPRRALYSDCVGFSRSLLGSLRLPGQEPQRLLLAEAVVFWSEHSDRAGLDSWCSALGHGTSRRNFLGRWAAGGSADKYVRAAYRTVEGLQLAAAETARAALRGAADVFGEEGTLMELESFLLGRGVPQEAARLQRLRLTSADAELPVPALLGDEFRVALPAAASTPASRWSPAPRTLAGSAPETPTEQVRSEGGNGGSSLEEPLEASDFDEDWVEQVQEDIDHETEPAPFGFVVAHTISGLKRLHFAGDCGKVAGVHYRSFECFGDTVPPSSAFDKRCITCFSKQERFLPDAQAAVPEESDSSTHSESDLEPASGGPARPLAQSAGAGPGSA